MLFVASMCISHTSDGKVGRTAKKFDAEEINASCWLPMRRRTNGWTDYLKVRQLYNSAWTKSDNNRGCHSVSHSIQTPNSTSQFVRCSCSCSSLFRRKRKEKTEKKKEKGKKVSVRSKLRILRYYGFITTTQVLGCPSKKPDLCATFAKDTRLGPSVQAFTYVDGAK